MSQRDDTEAQSACEHMGVPHPPDIHRQEDDELLIGGTRNDALESWESVLDQDMLLWLERAWEDLNRGRRPPAEVLQFPPVNARKDMA